MLDQSQFVKWVLQHAEYCTAVISAGTSHPHFAGAKPEDNTKDKIIRPLLDNLGYTAPEFRTTELGIAGDWVDYSLRTGEGGRFEVLVEAKPIFESDLWNKHREQVYQYAQEYRFRTPPDQEPAKWIILTNGFEVHILGTGDRKPHWSFTLNTPDDAAVCFNLLNRANVRDRVIDAIYLEERRETLDKDFLDDLKRWRLILANGFYAKNPHLPLGDVTLASQAYLNRLLFIRILETFRLRPFAWLARLYQQWKDAQWARSIRPFAREISVAFEDTEFRFNTELFKEYICDRLEIDDAFIEAVIVAAVPNETVLEKVPSGSNGLWNRNIYNYDFSELTVDVLGSVYERFLAHEFAVQNGRIVIRGMDEPTEARKLRRKEGIYYTPEWVTKFIVRECLRARLEEIQGAAVSYLREGRPDVAQREIMRLASIRVADIAMGSGSFLLQAYEMFHETYEKFNLVVEEERNRITSTQARPDLTKLMEYARIDDPATLALDSIYGVDLDAQAVELAKLNVWLRLLSKNAAKFRAMAQVHHLLPRLDLHFRQGNSLITPSRLPGFQEEVKAQQGKLSEIYAAFEEARSRPEEATISTFLSISSQLAYEVSRKLLEQYFGADAALKDPFVMEFAFPHVFLNPDGSSREFGGFDIVVGNPPYEVLSWRERGISPDDERKEKLFLDAGYATRFQKYNLYRFFLERATDLTASGGYVGYIIPLTLVADESSYKLRYKLFAETTILGLYCFPERARVFEGVTQAVCITILQKSKDWEGARNEEGWRATIQDSRLVRISYGLLDAQDLSQARPLAVEIGKIRSLHPRFMPIPLIPEVGWRVVDRLSLHPMLQDWEDRGLIEIKQREINLNEDRELYGTAPTPNRLVRGEHIAPFDLRLDLGTPEFVDKDAFLRKKGGAGFKSANDHEQVRIGVQEVSNLALTDRLKAALVPAGFFVGHTVDYIVPKQDGVDLDYLLGLINSDVLDWRFRLTSTNNHITTNQLRALPAPYPGGAENHALAGQLSGISGELISLSERLQRVRTEFAKALNQVSSLPSNLRAYSSLPGIVLENLLDDINKRGIVIELSLSFSEGRAVLTAIVSHEEEEDYRTGPKAVEPCVTIGAADPYVFEFLCLAIDRGIALHGDGKWTLGKEPQRVFETVLRALEIPVFSSNPEENLRSIHQVVRSLPEDPGSFGRILSERQDLIKKHREVCRQIFGVDELPALEMPAESELEESFAEPASGADSPSSENAP